MIDKVQVGKKYRLIDVECFLGGLNTKYNRHLLDAGVFDSEDCVVIDEVDDGLGYCNGHLIIHNSEYKYFELVEEPKVITPQTEVTITTTYGELARIYYVMGKVSGTTTGTTTSLWFQAGELLGDTSRRKYHKNEPSHSIISYSFVQKSWEALFFKTEEQLEKELEIESKRAAIKQLEEEIKKLESA